MNRNDMAVVDGSILSKDVSVLMVRDMEFEGVVYDLRTLDLVCRSNG
jgi:hypothetical protein